MLDQQITFVGTGQMARALGRGLVQRTLVRGTQITGFDPDPQACELFVTDIPGARIGASNPDVVRDSDVVILAVKPQLLAAVAQELNGVLGDNHVVVSIAAGVKLAQLAACLGTKRVVRVMPNTPCLVGKGASAFAAGDLATAADVELVSKMLEAVGFVCQLDERYLDAVTGLSGSGPAYIYVMIEALSDGGVRAGLPRDVATQLAAHTVRGAAEMVLGSGLHPGVLKDRVTSPGGTTIAGVQVLEEHAVRAAFIAAVEAAAERSCQLGETQ
jgi:pyrroline-5-carboxylate reductase